MMPALPNLVLTVGARSADSGEVPKSSGKAGEEDKSFASLMKLVLSPSGSPQTAKAKRPGLVEFPKHRPKTGDAAGKDNSLIGISPDLKLDPNVILASPQNVFIPTPSPNTPVAGQKRELAVESELACKTMPDDFGGDSKINSAGQPAGVLPVVVESKGISGSLIPRDLKTAISTVPRISSDAVMPEASTKLKVDDLEKTVSSERVYSDKAIIAANAKLGSAAPLPVPIAGLPAQMTGAPKIESKTSDQSPARPADAKITDSIHEAVARFTQPSEFDSKITASQLPALSLKAEPEAESAVMPSPDVDGTSIAKDDAAMKKTDKLNKFAGAMEKILPGNAAITAREGNSAARADLVVATNMADGSASSRNAADPSFSTNLIAGSSALDDRSRALERMHEMVVQHATRLNTSGVAALQVVIKPGAGTQLSLELRQSSGGGVEVRATLQHGDFNHLNQGWPELQQRLEQRGIRLAALAGDGSFAAGQRENSFQQKHNLPAEAFGEFVPAVAATGTFARPATVAAARRGWETWA